MQDAKARKFEFVFATSPRHVTAGTAVGPGAARLNPYHEHISMPDWSDFVSVPQTYRASTGAQMSCAEERGGMRGN